MNLREEINIPNLVAFWNFEELAPPYLSQGDGGLYRLRVERGQPPRPSSLGPFGTGVFLPAGTNLYIPYPEIGGLDMKNSQQVSVIAFAKRPEPVNNLMCIAGRWDEAGKGRQYALFHNVPLVGGANRPYGHISRYGGPTPGWKYSIDGSATKVKTTLADRLHCLGMTYNGRKAVSYLDGVADNNPRVTIRQTNPFKTTTTSRNPYYYSLGLNLNSKAPFRVNAASASGTTHHSRDVTIGALLVFNRALTATEMMQVYRAFIS